jgi:non-specific serine/threonine protein kinase
MNRVDGPTSKVRSVAVLDGLASLVDKNLLQQEVGADGETWFRLLETIRALALEQLDASGEAEATRRRHVAYVLELAEHLRPETGILHGPAASAWLRRLAREQDNPRSALRQLLNWGELEQAEYLAGTAAGWWWQASGQISDGRRWLADLLAEPDSASRPRSRGRLLTSAGVLATLQGDLAAAGPLFEEAFDLWRGLDDAASLARVAPEVGCYQRLITGRYRRARQVLEQGLTASQRAGRPEFEALNLLELGYLTWHEGDAATARRVAAEALQRATVS